jgi:hypothetical protein
MNLIIRSQAGLGLELCILVKDVMQIMYITLVWNSKNFFSRIQFEEFEEFAMEHQPEASSEFRSLY